MSINNSDIILSIILPIYNGEEYVDKAIKSLKIEKYPMCELILINDASTDGTENICLRWDAFKNIVYIKLRENHGAAHARNCGVEISHGKYITFLDCDDMLIDNAIEIYLKAILRYNVDLIISGYAIVKHFNKKYNVKRNQLKNKDEFIKSMFFFDASKKVRYGVLWGKIYKRTVLYSKNKIIFKEGILIGEDTWFNIEYYNRMKNVLFLSDITYMHIVQNKDSLTHQYEKQYFNILISTLKRYKKLFSYAGHNSFNLFTVSKTIQLYWRALLYYGKYYLNMRIYRWRNR